MSTFSQLIQSDKPVPVDFSAEWCGPCKMMAPILKEVAGQLGDQATILKVDVDRNPQAAAHYGIRASRRSSSSGRGEIKWRQSGVVPAPQLKQVIEQYV
ncbi:thioredoxin family protein [Candidatus Pollutiaquabacter sp.]|uniref:thioredoxin family protein n=1 Tax=Candidatus Pollutiaquabacter sp. TaxID=3416354 RepID=UPI003C9664C3|nr:thiol reductase thioredoxin [Bacteroidota bacterium]